MYKSSKELQDVLFPLLGATVGGGLGYGGYNLLSDNPTSIGGISAGLAGAGLGAIGGYGINKHEEFMKQMRHSYDSLKKLLEAEIAKRKKEEQGS